MGPSIKFFSAIQDAFSNQNIGAKFFGKRTNAGEGIREKFGGGAHFFRSLFFDATPPKVFSSHSDSSVDCRQ